MTSLNLLVFRMVMVDNNSKTVLASDFSGERLLDPRQKTQPAADLTELILRSKSGHLEAFEQLYNLYKRKVYGLVFNLTRNHQTAEDLTQEIFMKVFAAIQTIEQPELFPTWVYRISLNTCYSYSRREKTFDQKLEVMAQVEEGNSDEAFDSRQDDLARAVSEAVAQLPEKLRTVFLLHEVEGLTHEEIAKNLGCQVGTSKSQLFKARMKLRKILKKKSLLKGEKL